jgi:hypothetical protein
MTNSPYVLGLYIAIGVMTSAAIWQLLTRLVMPAFRSRNIRVERYLIGFGALAAMTAHWWENIVFGIGRWEPEFRFLLTDPKHAVLGKIMILVSAMVTLAALDRARTGSAHFARWILTTIAAYTGGVLVAMIYQAAG